MAINFQTYQRPNRRTLEDRPLDVKPFPLGSGYEEPDYSPPLALASMPAEVESAPLRMPPGKFEVDNPDLTPVSEAIAGGRPDLAIRGPRPAPTNPLDYRYPKGDFGAEIGHRPDQERGFGNRLKHALLAAGLGALQGIQSGAENPLAAAIGGAAAGGIGGAISPSGFADRLRYNMLIAPGRQAEMEQAQKQQGFELKRRETEADIGLKGAQRQKYEADARIAGQPKQPRTFVIGNRIVDETGKVIYTGPDAQTKWQQLQGAAEPTLFDPITGTTKPLGVKGKPSATEGQEAKAALGQQEKFDKLITEARELKARAEFLRAQKPQRGVSDPELRDPQGEAARIEKEAEDKFKQAESLGAAATETYGGTMTPLEPGKQEPVYKAPGKRSGNAKPLPPSTESQPKGGGQTRKLSDLTKYLK